MTPERWQAILGNVKDGFPVEKSGREHFEEEGGVDIEYIIFKGPLGRMKLEFITRPAILDKKTTYSRRIGSETQVEYVYSQTEKNHKLFAYKWEEGQDDWVEMEARKFVP